MTSFDRTSFDRKVKTVSVLKQLTDIFEQASRPVDGNIMVSAAIKGTWSKMMPKNPEKLKRPVKHAKLVFSAKVLPGEEENLLEKLGNKGMAIVPIPFLLKYIPPEELVSATEPIHFTTERDIMCDTLTSYIERICRRCGARNRDTMAKDLTTQELSKTVCTSCLEEISNENAITHKRKMNECTAEKEKRSEEEEDFDSEETESDEWVHTHKRNRGIDSLPVNFTLKP